MANPEHLAILDKGVEAWNAWRAGATGVEPDLEEADLSYADLRGCNLSRTRLVSSDLHGADLYRAELSNASLEGSVLTSALLSDADLTGASLNEADLSGASLARADLRGAVLTGANLTNADLRRARLHQADLRSAYFFGTNLRGAEFVEADLREVDLSGRTNTSLRGIDLSGAKLQDSNLDWTYLKDTRFKDSKLGRAKCRNAYFSDADLSGADFTECLLYRANLFKTSCTGTDFSRANLRGASLVDVSLERALFDDCTVYGLSAWNVQGMPKSQKDLVITPRGQAEITVDNLEVAQFVYLLLNNQRLRSVLDTMTSKVVLILGRFSAERKAVLDALRAELRRHDYVPVIFDFDQPMDKSIADTVTTLAKLARFVIADVTDPSWVTVETQLIVRESRSVPFRLIKHASASVPSPINDLRVDSPQLIQPFDYTSLDHAVGSVEEIVEPAEEMAERIRQKRRAIEDDPW